LTKPDYGLDAPPVVRNLIVAGACCLVAGFVGFGLLAGIQPALAVGVLIAMLFSVLCFLVTVAAMAWSSRRGKLRLRERLVDSLGLQGSEVVLDVGCGRGLLLNYAAKKLSSGKAIGLDLWQTEDLSGNALEVTLSNARRENVVDKVEVRSGDMRKMPFPDESVDIVLSNIAVHNIVDQTGREQAIREISRVLRPGGRAVIADFRHVEEYASILKSLHWSSVEVSARNFLIFPPVRVLRGTKPGPRARADQGSGSETP